MGWGGEKPTHCCNFFFFFLNFAKPFPATLGTFILQFIYKKVHILSFDPSSWTFVICFLLLHTDIEVGGLIGMGWQRVLAPPSLPPHSPPPTPMQVSQFLLSHIICSLSSFCDRVSCSHGLSLKHPNNEHQSLATLALSYIMNLFNSNELHVNCFEH